MTGPSLDCDIHNSDQFSASMDVVSESEDISENESLDSDTELQRAFAAGELKPGLNVEAAAPKTLINNVSGMKGKLEELKSTLPWVERLDLTIKAGTPSAALEQAEGQVHDDFKREMKFYTQAQQAAVQGLKKLQQMGIPTKRPEDYFAQMAKSDSHMKKVREKLLSRQLGMERSEKAKKLRELRKYGKKVQVEVIQKRHKQKREMLEAVKKYRKGKQDSLDFLEGEGPSQNKQKPGQLGKKTDNKPGKKRDWKNKKFGYGGQKKRSKYNTKDSASDMTGFSGRKHATTPSKLDMMKMTNKNKKRRLGKDRRQQSRTRKR